MLIRKQQRSAVAAIVLAVFFVFACGEDDDGGGTTSPAGGDGADAADAIDGGAPDAESTDEEVDAAASDASAASDAELTHQEEDAADPSASAASDAELTHQEEDAADRSASAAADVGGEEVDAGDANDSGPLGADSVEDAAAAWPADKYITIDEVYQRSQVDDPDMLLVNVVDEMFYNLGHIAGSLQITWDTLSDNLDQLSADRHVVIYCRKGVRSESAYDTLRANGYSMVWVMEGGIEAWTAAGYPTVSD